MFTVGCGRRVCLPSRPGVRSGPDASRYRCRGGDDPQRRCGRIEIDSPTPPRERTLVSSMSEVPRAQWPVASVFCPAPPTQRTLVPSALPTPYLKRLPTAMPVATGAENTRTRSPERYASAIEVVYRADAAWLIWTTVFHCVASLMLVSVEVGASPPPDTTRRNHNGVLRGG